jgi:hypothetical protein
MAKPANSHDPQPRTAYSGAGPLPTDPLRIFAPLCAGDIQTSRAYLENATIRLASVVSQGEKFTTFEQRAIQTAFENLATTLSLIQGILIENGLMDRVQIAPIAVDKPRCGMPDPGVLYDEYKTTQCVLDRDTEHEWHEDDRGMKWRFLPEKLSQETTP